MRPTVISVNAKGIVDFVRHKVRFCDFFFFSEHYITSVHYAFVLVTNFLTLMCVLRS